MKILKFFTPKSMAGQMIAILAFSLTVLLGALAIPKILEQHDAVEWAESRRTLHRLRNMIPILETLPASQVKKFFFLNTSYHKGYSLTSSPLDLISTNPATKQLEELISRKLRLRHDEMNIGYAPLMRHNFSFGVYDDMPETLPMDGVIISIKIRPGQWFNTAIDPHEEDYRDLFEWLMWSVSSFLFTGIVAIFLMRHLAKPLNNLTNATQRFGVGLTALEVKESGPPDLKRAIKSFNAMQRQVTEEVKKRTHLLAAISHDLRTPLTALRIKAELIDDDEVKEDLVRSINKMEKMITSALEFMKVQSRTEPLRNVDLSALVESECNDFEEMGYTATFQGEQSIHYSCRPNALAHAVRNLIENANKYGGGACVTLQTGPDYIDISVTDKGPGIAEDKIKLAVEPFERLSKARESSQGGFGLGLSIAKAVTEGHGGELLLEPNEPTGLQATIRLAN